MTAIFGGGFLLEKPSTLQRVDSLQRGLRVLARASALPAEGGFEREPLPYDQGHENSCCGHFVAQAGWLLTGDKWSPQFPYYFGRLRDVLYGDRVTDNGARLATVAEACRVHGVCHYSLWNRRLADYDVNEIPPALARLQAQRKLVDIAPIIATGSTLVNRICDSLYRQQPVGIVVAIDEQFDAGKGVIGPAESLGRGLHVVTGIRYRTRADGKREVQIVNSWSKSWGDNGKAWLSHERLQQSPYVCFVRGIRKP